MLTANAQRLSTTRWLARAPRVGLIATCCVLSVVGLRDLVSSPAQPSRVARPAAPPDTGSQAFAEAFTRDFLTWDGTGRSDPEALAIYGVNLAPAEPPTGLEQSVRWTSVTAARRASLRDEVITVVAQTTRGREALAVTVRRDPSGARQIVGQPAVVGALPRAESPARPPTGREVDDQQLTAVVERALRNYLGRDGADLRADLAADARVALPERPSRVLAADTVTWVRSGSRVAATVRAVDRDRVQMTLRYELTVTKQAGRWLVRAIHTNPEVQ